MSYQIWNKQRNGRPSYVFEGMCVNNAIASMPRTQTCRVCVINQVYLKQNWWVDQNKPDTGYFWVYISTNPRDIKVSQFFSFKSFCSPFGVEFRLWYHEIYSINTQVHPCCFKIMVQCAKAQDNRITEKPKESRGLACSCESHDPRTNLSKIGIVFKESWFRIVNLSWVLCCVWCG